mgnify:CR=1 FL=1
MTTIGSNDSFSIPLYHNPLPGSVTAEILQPMTVADLQLDAQITECRRRNNARENLRRIVAEVKSYGHSNAILEILNRNGQ